MDALPLHPMVCDCGRCPRDDDDDGFPMFVGCVSGIATGAVLIAIIDNASAIVELVGGLIR